MFWTEASLEGNVILECLYAAKTVTYHYIQEYIREVTQTDNEPSTPPANPTSQPFQLFAKQHDGRTTVLNVTSNETVGLLKWKIEELSGVPRSQFRLAINNKTLDKKETLGYYNLHQESEITVNLYIRGGQKEKWYVFYHAREVGVKFGRWDQFLKLTEGFAGNKPRAYDNEAQPG